MTRSLLLAALSATLILGASAAYAQSNKNLKGDKKAGRTFVYTCAGCHGVPDYQNEYPTYHVPRLAGQNEQYIVDALHEYKTGQRKHPTMDAQAEAMSDQDIANIAAYLSSIKPPKGAEASALDARAKAGQKKAVTCEACHGKHGVSVSPQYPNLAGQYADYIVQVLHEYKDGQRQNAIMKGMASQLSDEDMRDIAAYYSAQKPVLDNLKHHIQGSD
jgi:cytochrome c553